MAMPEIRHKVIREPQETIARIESKVPRPHGRPNSPRRQRRRPSRRT
jgi:hypothetical protein